ncbi:MAG TPA: ATP-binding protein, partial [Polyangiales bacterium]|nr:ATP-binding protein [Polyangiales bacterium]
SEREQRLITETIPALVWRSTPEGMPDYINQRLMKYVGKTLAEFVREQLIHPDDVDKTLNSWDRARAEERPWEDTHRLLGADGQYRWFTSRGHPLRDETGRIVRWYGFNFDIDSSKKLEEVLKVTQARLSRASEIAAIAELAASIAHEINQPLASVVANGGACLGLLSAEPPDLERARRTAERVIRDGHAASEVIKRIRALFRQAPSTKVPLDLNEVVREVHELMMGEVLTSDIHMSVELASDLPRTLADRVQLQQVLVNLIRNALESMESVVDRSRALSIRTRCDALGSVTLEVCDAGPGLDTAQSIFEPFFTTKARGMGMGLAICRSIIEAHDGKIWARRNDTHGATFGFALPIHVSGPQPA